MAGTVPRIAAPFTVDRGLDDHPVYFLTVGGVGVVVKGEKKTADDAENQEIALSIKWSSKLMKNVNNAQVNTKIMDAAEVAAFLQAARLKFRPLPPPPGQPPNPPSKRYQNVTARAQDYTWVKMPSVAGLTDADFTKKVGGFTQAIPLKVKEQIVKFTDESIWPQLGKVLAVDIFNGNNDRFHTEQGDWVNYGNVMFVDQGARVIGLDTFDPYSDRSMLGNKRNNAALDTLVDPVRQRDFALRCTRSVGETLARDAFANGAHYITLRLDTPDGIVPWQVERSDVEALYVPFAPTMAAGLARGADELKTYLQRKVTEYKQRRAAAAPPVGRPLPVPPGGRARAAGGPPPPVQATRPRAAPGGPPAVDRVALTVAQTGMPEGIIDRMHYLGWLP